MLMPSLYRCILPLALLSALLLSGCASAPEPAAEPLKPAVTILPQPALPALPAGAVRVNGIAAIVNDEVITIREVIREAQPVINESQRKGLVDDKARSDLRKMVLERLIEKKLTDQKVKELGIKIGDDEIRQAIDDVKRQNNNMTQQQLAEALKKQGYTLEQYEIQIREQLERLRLVSMEVRSKVYVSPKEVEAYYAANLARYAEDEQFRARHIFIKVDEAGPAETLQKAMAKALDILHEARNGKDFAELARQHSDDPAAKKDGGDLGSFKRGEMLADLEQALLPLKPGEVGELVKTPSGLHIVKLEGRESGKVKPFEQVKAEIEDQLYRTRQDERFSQWLKELRAKASIEIKDNKGMI
jgi:peptidyl-prolyl cis-trans isomerase SurA